MLPSQFVLGWSLISALISVPTNWASSKEYSGNLEEWMPFARHTSVSRWRFGTHETEFPLYLDMEVKGSTQLVTYDAQGNKLDVATALVKTGPQTNMLFLSFTLDVHYYYKAFSGPLTCQLPQEERLRLASETVMDVSEEGKGRVHNVILVIEQGSAHPKDTLRTGKYGVSKNYKTSKIAMAASLDDIKPILISMVFEASETNYNLFLLLRGTSDRLETTKKLIESTSEEDSWACRLRQSGSMIDSSTFAHVPRDTNGNCADHFIYKDGRYVRQSPDLFSAPLIQRGQSDILTLLNCTIQRFPLCHFRHPEGQLEAGRDGAGWQSKNKTLLTPRHLKTTQPLPGRGTHSQYCTMRGLATSPSGTFGLAIHHS